MIAQKSNSSISRELCSAFLFLFILSFSNKAQAQCNIQFNNLSRTDTFCVGELIQFRDSIVSFGATYLWDFGDGNSSTTISPIHKYSSSGTFSVTYAKSNSSGTCRDTLTAFIKPSPHINVSFLTSDTMCFKDNSVCLVDSTKAINGQVVNQTWMFSDGHRLDTSNINLQFPTIVCHQFQDPHGGSFNLVVEAEDSNGCISQEVYEEIIYVQPKIGTNFKHGPYSNNYGCQTATSIFVNTSHIQLSEVDSFIWNFGDGTVVVGNNIDTTLWDTVSHLYTTQGTFDVSLEIFDHNGCQDKYKWREAVSNIILDPQITRFPSSKTIAISENPIEFSVANLPSSLGVRAFIWDFGIPYDGAGNYNDLSLQPQHSFDLGPHLVSLDLYFGPCSIALTDTFQIVGPLAAIESKENRISLNEKFQCASDDSIHFTNNSRFYQNDLNKLDEDSIITINGKTQFAFNYTPRSPGTNRQGDLTSLASTDHIANRTMGSQVWRIWDFGDKYAPQCTTSTEKGINVGVNCNFSEDEHPTHKYTRWDSIYYTHYFLTNDTFEILKYNDSLNNCYVDYVDTSNMSKHLEIFSKTIPQDYSAKLWLKDTITGIVNSDEVTIKLHAPKADKMTVSKKNWCEVDCTWPRPPSNLICYAEPDKNSNYVEFDLGVSSISYYAINFDSAANPHNFERWDSLRARTGYFIEDSPGIQHETLEYDQLPTRILKGYIKDEIDKGANKTIGLIVGSGATDSNGLPACVDTFWYHDMIQLTNFSPKFDIIEPQADKKTICAGEAAYFKLDNPKQNDISMLRWDWGAQGIGKGPMLDTYTEQFKYMEKYTGPTTGRNDKDIAYNGEDWYYNYVIRIEASDAFGFVIKDTIVTSIIKDWKVDTKFNYPEYLKLFDNEGTYTEIDEKDLFKLFGDGSFGCIDTTGLSSLIEINKKEYRTYYDDQVFLRGNKRYRYTNSTKTDSVEVAHILHFRDSSLQGYDTLIRGSDTTFGVWKKQYVHPLVTDGDTTYHPTSGPMKPTLLLKNTTGCQGSESKLLNIGFHNRYWFEDEKPICEGLPVFIEDSLRYWQYGVEDPYTYPIKEYSYWQYPWRYVNNREYHEVDWGDNGGVWNPQRSVILYHMYHKPGNYTITIVAKDSMGCRDTTTLYQTVSELNVDFKYDSLLMSCDGVVDFTDLSSTVSNSDKIISWEWEFGDGTRRSLLQNPKHSFLPNKFEYEVELIARTSAGCYDSITKTIKLIGPTPHFEYADYTISLNDTLEIYVSDSLYLENLSAGYRITNSKFAMDWGDGNFTAPPNSSPIFGHKYDQSGIYELHLIMEGSLPDGNRCSKIFPDSINPDHKNFVVRVLPDSLNNVEILENRIGIYPNPTSTDITIDVNSKLNLMSVSVYDAMGRKQNIEIEQNGRSKYFLYLDGLSNGTYVLLLETSSGTITKRFVIMK